MAEKRVKVHTGAEPPPPEVRNAYDEVYWEPPGADKLHYDKATGKWDKAMKAAAQPATAPLGKPQGQRTWEEKMREKSRAGAEERVGAAQTQEVVAARGTLGGLGLGERARVQSWLKQNPGKSVDDARRALGMTAKKQAEALR